MAQLSPGMADNLAMIDLLALPTLQTAEALRVAVERAVSSWPEVDPVAAELRAACADVLAQSIYMMLRPAGEARFRARQEVRRASRRIALLIDLGLGRGTLDRSLRDEVLRWNDAVWQAARPAPPPLPGATEDDAPPPRTVQAGLMALSARRR